MAQGGDEREAALRHLLHGREFNKTYKTIKTQHITLGNESKKTFQIIVNFLHPGRCFRVVEGDVNKSPRNTQVHRTRGGGGPRKARTASSKDNRRESKEGWRDSEDDISKKIPHDRSFFSKSNQSKKIKFQHTEKKKHWKENGYGQGIFKN